MVIMRCRGRAGRVKELVAKKLMQKMTEKCMLEARSTNVICAYINMRGVPCKYLRVCGLRLSV